MNKEMLDARDLLIKKVEERASREELKRAIDYSKAVIDAHKEAK